MVWSLCNVFNLLPKVYEGFLVITRSLTNRKLEIACSKFFFKKYICWDLYSEKTPCILSDHLPKRPLNLSFTFWWPLTGGSTVHMLKSNFTPSNSSLSWSSYTAIWQDNSTLFLTNTNPVRTFIFLSSYLACYISYVNRNVSFAHVPCHFWECKDLSFKC